MSEARKDTPIVQGDDTPVVQGDLDNAYWHRFVLEDGSVLRVVFYVDALYRLRDEWLLDGTRQRTYDEAVSVFLTPGWDRA
jgi:hypothetical protein